MEQIQPLAEANHRADDAGRLERAIGHDRATRPVRRDVVCVTRLCWGDAMWRGVRGLADGIGFLRELDQFGVHAALPAVCEAAMSAYRGQLPEARWERIRAFVEDAAAAAAPACAYTMNRLLIVISGYVDWAVSVAGYPQQANIVFRGELIKRYVERTDVDWTPSTRRSYRSLLKRVSEILIPDAPVVGFAPQGGRPESRPYTEGELRDLVRWADAQSSAERRRRAAVLLACCCGAGLWAHEVIELRRSDVVIDDEGVLIRIRGRNARTIPLLARWESILLEGTGDLGPDELVFGRSEHIGDAKNLITTFMARSDHTGIERPQTIRMRATWLVTHLAAGTDMRSLMRAGGVEKFENLIRLIQHVPALDTAEYRRMLREAVAE